MSSWWPAEIPSTKQMHMDVKHGLPGGGIAVGDGSIAGRGDGFVFSDLPGGQVELPHDVGMAGVEIVQCCYVFLGDNEDMRRRLRVNVTKGQHMLVFVHRVGLDFTTDHFTKQAVAHVVSPHRLSSNSTIVLRYRLIFTA